MTNEELIRQAREALAEDPHWRMPWHLAGKLLDALERSERENQQRAELVKELDQDDVEMVELGHDMCNGCGDVESTHAVRIDLRAAGECIATGHYCQACAIERRDRIRDGIRPAPKIESKDESWLTDRGWLSPQAAAELRRERDQKRDALQRESLLLDDLRAEAARLQRQVARMREALTLARPKVGAEDLDESWDAARTAIDAALAEAPAAPVVEIPAKLVEVPARESVITEEDYGAVLDAVRTEDLITAHDRERLIAVGWLSPEQTKELRRERDELFRISEENGKDIAGYCSDMDAMRAIQQQAAKDYLLLRDQADAALMERDQALAACAAFRAYIAPVLRVLSKNRFDAIEDECHHLDELLRSTEAGKGWASPATVEKVCERLDSIASTNHTTDCIIHERLVQQCSCHVREASKALALLRAAGEAGCE